MKNLLILIALLSAIIFTSSCQKQQLKKDYSITVFTDEAMSTTDVGLVEVSVISGNDSHKLFSFSGKGKTVSKRIGKLNPGETLLVGVHMSDDGIKNSRKLHGAVSLLYKGKTVETKSFYLYRTNMHVVHWMVDLKFLIK